MRRPGLSPSSLSGRRVLVVEDDYLLADDTAAELRETGAEVVGPVGDVQGALALVEAAGRLDAAVLDINLSGEMVWPVADRLAERGVPFVFATGYEAAVVPPRHAGAPHCTKPVEPGQIARMLPGPQASTSTA